MKKRTAKKARRDGTEMGRRLIDAMRELTEHAETGRPFEARFTVRTVRLRVEPGEYSPERLRAFRASAEASQAIFAKFLGVSAKALGERRR